MAVWMHCVAVTRKREVTYIVVVVPTNDVWKFSVTEAVKEFPDIRNNSLFLFHSLVLFVV